MEAFIGEIRIVGFNFAPTGWAACDGQLLPISQNTALFSLLGTTYGGNGTSTFALPNLQARCAIGAGQGIGLRDRQLGETGGQAGVALTVAEMPAHPHGARTANSSTTKSPADALLAPTASGPAFRASGVMTAMSAESVGATGASSQHENRQPFQAVQFVIAMQGIYPPRS